MLVSEKTIKFGSISNFVRHHFGVVAQSVGRKKKNIEPAFVIIETDKLIEREVKYVVKSESETFTKKPNRNLLSNSTQGSLFDL